MPAGAEGTVAVVQQGTVVAARMIQFDASSTEKNLGTGIGAGIGAGSGAMLGRGSGNIVSTVGFGIVGSLAGRGIAKAAGTVPGQELDIRIDNSKEVLRVKQRIYENIGAIPVGVHGTLERGGGYSKFVPDGI